MPAVACGGGDVIAVAGQRTSLSKQNAGFPAQKHILVAVLFALHAGSRDLPIRVRYTGIDVQLRNTRAGNFGVALAGKDRKLEDDTHGRRSAELFALDRLPQGAQLSITN